MPSNLVGYYCIEYLDEYYSFGLFHGTECQEIYSHEKMSLDENKEFLRIGEIYDDNDLLLGYRKNEKGIWGHYNRHYDGTFQLVSESLKEFCEGWYQRNPTYWCEMDSTTQWKEMSYFFKLNIEKYLWRGEKIKEFIDYCINHHQLTKYYIKAYKTLIGITTVNGFSTRSSTNMAYLKYEQEEEAYHVVFKANFFDHYGKSKKYKFDKIDEAINDIDNWIINDL